MGVLDELDLRVKPANAAQRLAQRLASSRPVAWLSQRMLYPVDKALFEMSAGRVTFAGLVAGLPVVMLTTTGNNSGRPITMPLLGIPIDRDLAVIGTNYGQQPTPGWVYNLEADPTATVRYRDRSARVIARRANAEETERTFELAKTIYLGYRSYRQRVSQREIRVFILTPP